jgi:hypothetical protein
MEDAGHLATAGYAGYQENAVHASHQANGADAGRRPPADLETSKGDPDRPVLLLQATRTSESNTAPALSTKLNI